MFVIKSGKEYLRFVGELKPYGYWTEDINEAFIFYSSSDLIEFLTGTVRCSWDTEKIVRIQAISTPRWEEVETL